MSNTTDLLEKARSLCKPPTWYRLSKETGIADSTISRCMRRGGTLDNENAFRLATFLEKPVEEILAMIEVDRAATPEKKSFWERYVPRLLPAIVAALAIAGATQERKETEGMSFHNSLNGLYLMRTLRRWLFRGFSKPVPG